MCPHALPCGPCVADSEEKTLPILQFLEVLDDASLVVDEDQFRFIKCTSQPYYHCACLWWTSWQRGACTIDTPRPGGRASSVVSSRAAC